MVAVTSVVPAKHVCFRLRGQLFGADIGDVKETVEPGPLTRVFLVDPCIAGVMSLRGDIVAVIDLAAFLGMAGARTREESGRPRVLIAQVRDAARRERTAGLLVDRLEEVRLVDPSGLQPPPPAVDPQAASFLRGVVSLPDGPLGILDLHRVLGGERFRRYARKAA